MLGTLLRTLLRVPLGPLLGVLQPLRRLLGALLDALFSAVFGPVSGAVSGSLLCVPTPFGAPLVPSHVRSPAPSRGSTRRRVARPGAVGVSGGRGGLGSHRGRGLLGGDDQGQRRH